MIVRTSAHLATLLVGIAWLPGEASAQSSTRALSVAAAPRSVGEAVLRPTMPIVSDPTTTGTVGSASRSRLAALPPEIMPEIGRAGQLPRQFQRSLVDYSTREPVGTIIIDTVNTHLYLVLGNGKAMRYGIGVGREGFTWAGAEKVSKMAEWPDWHPPSEMIGRQPYLPRFMAGGEGNPLGARALYLGNTLYRIHGTNQPSTIGTFVSSGCIRLTNRDITDLYSRVKVGTRVVVLPGRPPTAAVFSAGLSAGVRPVPPSDVPSVSSPPVAVSQFHPGLSRGRR